MFTGSNKLARVQDLAGDTRSYPLDDFNDGANSDDDYAYDANGNLTQDQNKQIQSISYNILNLPETITVTGKGSILYLYDASGTKLAKQVTQAGSQKTTSYLGAMIFENDILQHISMGEGRFRPNGSVFTADYFLKDHLGNVRAMVNEDGSLLEENGYYPFGLIQRGLSYTNTGVALNKFKYNNKELQSNEFTDGTGLDAYDYGARMYNAQIGRGFQPDPLSEMYFGATPYNYTLNNPISLFDPDGRDAIIEFDRDKDGNITGIRIRSTIYFKGGTAEQRKQYVDDANAFVKSNSQLFSGKTKDADGNSISISININYQDLGDMKESEIGAGNNIADISGLESTKSSVAYGGDKDIGDFDKGRFRKTGVDYNTAGTTLALRSDSKTDPGRTTVHETFHLLGLSDRYTDSYPNGERKSFIPQEFKTDIMGSGQLKGVTPTVHQTHWNNWGTYLTQPQFQQQQTQNPGQFILRYRVDIEGTGPVQTRKLITR